MNSNSLNPWSRKWFAVEGFHEYFSSILLCILMLFDCKRTYNSIMASSKVVIMTTMAVLLSVASAAHAAEAPAPSPTSPGTVISPSFAVGFLTAAVALVFGSSLRI